MYNDINEMTLQDIANFKILKKEELKNLTYAELCIYLERLNQVKARYHDLMKK